MDLSTRQALEELIKKFAYKTILGIIKSKETSPQIDSKTKLEKGTKNDYDIISDECSKIFFKSLENYMNKNHIVLFNDIPNEITRKLALQSISIAINNWSNKNNP